jgi:hypothetical protein
MKERRSIPALMGNKLRRDRTHPAWIATPVMPWKLRQIRLKCWIPVESAMNSRLNSTYEASMAVLPLKEIR